jgi:thiosulfate dehydrogenase [quinone] large subunit
MSTRAAGTGQAHDIPEPNITRFLFAGTAGANPLMFILAILLMLAWRVAGWWGLDRWALPLLGVPGTPGTMFRRNEAGTEGRA